MDSLPQRKPSAFPAPPKSALFDRLEAFLPQLASENRKLEAAIASGDGDRHNIEIPVDDEAGDEENKKKSKNTPADVDSEDEEDDVDMDGDRSKPPVIEMNFALGLMEVGGSDSDSDAEEDAAAGEVDLKAILAARGQAGEDGGVKLTTDKPQPQQATQPLIQELN